MKKKLLDIMQAVQSLVYAAIALAVASVVIIPFAVGLLSIIWKQATFYWFLFN